MSALAIEQRLPRTDRAPGVARALVGDRAAADLPPLVAENLLLVISELVSNGVRHARGDGLVLRVWRRGATIRVEVENGGGGFRLQSSPDRPDEGAGGGLGLHLVAVISERWGLESNGTTIVWAELSTTSAALH